MTQVIPEGVTSNAHVPVYFFPDVADLEAPTVAELTATGVVQLDCYLVGGGLTVNKATTTRNDFRLCMRQAATRRGATTYTITLQGVYDGQDTTPDENQLYNTLREDAGGVLGIAWGHDTETDLAAGDHLDLVRGTVGNVVKNSPVQDEDLTINVEWLGEVWVEDATVAGA